MYINGDWTSDYLGDEMIEFFDHFAELAFRTHADESLLETTLLQTRWIDSFGMAVEADSDHIDLTTATVLDAEYPEPALPTASAGEGLFPYFPDDTLVIFSSYGLPLNLKVVDTLYLQPLNDLMARDLVYDLLASPRPGQQPTPTTPEVLAQGDTLYHQYEQMLGTKISEVFELVSGEYAITLFSNSNELSLLSSAYVPTGAFYLHTDQPIRVLEILDTLVNNLNLTSPEGWIQLIRREEMFNGVNVVIWQSRNYQKVLAYGALSEEVVFITNMPDPAYITTVRDNTMLVNTAHWPADVISSYGEGQDALFYFKFDEEFSDLTSQVNSLILTVDVEADGVFITHTTFFINE
jgi:hypothetical protein